MQGTQRPAILSRPFPATTQYLFIMSQTNQAHRLWFIQRRKEKTNANILNFARLLFVFQYNCYPLRV